MIFEANEGPFKSIATKYTHGNTNIKAGQSMLCGDETHQIVDTPIIKDKSKGTTSYLVIHNMRKIVLGHSPQRFSEQCCMNKNRKYSTIDQHVGSLFKEKALEILY